ncbi:MAG: type II secretion system protein [Parcubacteria group bacterium]|nr:type II secretion system protein [Parcubacteria group bacterium]
MARRFYNGFTLVEILVSIAIFVLITTGVVINFRTGENRRVLDLGTQNAAGILRKAQFWSLSGKSQLQGTNLVFPSGGYGIRVEPCSASPCGVIFFADWDGELDYDDSEKLAGEGYTLPADLLIESVAPSQTSDIVFKPPVPSVCVNRDCSNVPVTAIVVRHVKDNRRAEIRILQGSGQISVK